MLLGDDIQQLHGAVGAVADLLVDIVRHRVPVAEIGHDTVYFRQIAYCRTLLFSMS